MRFDTKRIAPLAQLALLIAAVIGTVSCLTSLGHSAEGTDELVKLLDQYTTTQPAGERHAPGEPAKTPAERTAERLAKRYIFSPAPAKPSLSAKLQGVLGDKAYFVGKPEGLAVGQEINGAKITEIGPDWVKVEFQGKPQTLRLAPSVKGISPAKDNQPRPTPSRGGPGAPPQPPGETIKLVPAPGGDSRAMPPSGVTVHSRPVPADAVLPGDRSMGPVRR